MSYVLGLSFEYHRYHRDATMRIYADNRLVDECLLEKDIKLKALDCHEMPPGFLKPGPRTFRKITIMPEKLFLFNISEAHLCNNIRIEVDNNYNNHTNGFMTEYAYIKFYSIFLIPECMLQYKNWKLLNRFDIDYVPSNRVKNRDWLLDNGFNAHFPTAGNSEADINFLQGKEQNSRTFIGFKKGGSFEFEIPTTKKHNIVHFGKLKPGKIQPNREIQRTLWCFNALNMDT